MSNAQPRGQSLSFIVGASNYRPGYLQIICTRFETEGPKDILGQGSQKTETLVTLKSLARTPG